MSKHWPDSRTFWRDKRVTVTGGGGFLGGFVVEKLRERGATEICVPRKRDYDLVQREAVLALLHDARPDLIIHLTASVGGIGANLAHQAEYFYENLMMGTQLLHEAYVAGVAKFVGIGTICAYPNPSLRQAQYKRQAQDKVCAHPLQGSRSVEGYPEETNAPYGLAKKPVLSTVEGMMLVQSQVASTDIIRSSCCR